VPVVSDRLTRAQNLLNTLPNGNSIMLAGEHIIASCRLSASDAGQRVGFSDFSKTMAKTTTKIIV
jgi:hypothetical protein